MNFKLGGVKQIDNVVMDVLPKAYPLCTTFVKLQIVDIFWTFEPELMFFGGSIKKTSKYQNTSLHRILAFPLGRGRVPNCNCTLL